MLSKIFDEILNLFELIISNYPGGTGRIIRKIYYKFRLGEMGKGVIIDCGVRIINPRWVKIGNNTWIDNYVIILAGPPTGDRKVYSRKVTAFDVPEGFVSIGDNCHIAPFVVLQGHGGLTIGNDITVASGCKIYTLSHHYRNLNDPKDKRRFKFSSMAPEHEQSLISAPIIIANSAAVGLNSVILPGCQISAGAWIAPGSIVREDIPADTLYGFVPEIIRKVLPERP